MKKVKAMILFLTVLSFTVVFLSCSSSNTNNKNTTQQKTQTVEKVKIGLSLASEQEERWIRDMDTIVAECKKSQISLIVESAEMNSDRQVAQCADMLAKGIQVLILVPQDAMKASEIIDMAHAKGVKVISYDRLVLDSDVDIYLSFDNEKVGELQGKALTDAVPKGNYIVFSGAPNDNNSKYFLSGAMKYIQPLADRGDIQIVMNEPVDNWEPNNAYELVKKALEKNNNNIQAILSPNDGLAAACIKALDEQKLGGKVIVTGQDAEILGAKRIAEGTQLMTVFKDTRDLGKKAVEVALELVKDRKIETNSAINNNKINVPSVLLSPVSVDKNNMEEVLINSGYLNRNSVYTK